MPPLTVVYDASVLFSARLRDLLMELALTDLLLARWTDDIHAEWMRAVLRNRPDIPIERIDRVRTLMDAHVRDAKVTGYEHLIPDLNLPDPEDRHVLAAAIQAGASIIVSFNLRDFPADSLAPYGIQALHPDDFLTQLVARDALQCISGGGDSPPATLPSAPLSGRLRRRLAQRRSAADRPGTGGKRLANSPVLTAAVTSPCYRIPSLVVVVRSAAPTVYGVGS